MTWRHKNKAMDPANIRMMPFIQGEKNEKKSYCLYYFHSAWISIWEAHVIHNSSILFHSLLPAIYQPELPNSLAESYRNFLVTLVFLQGLQLFPEVFFDSSATLIYILVHTDWCASLGLCSCLYYWPSSLVWSFALSAFKGGNVSCHQLCTVIMLPPVAFTGLGIIPVTTVLTRRKRGFTRISK